MKTFKSQASVNSVFIPQKHATRRIKQKSSNAYFVFSIALKTVTTVGCTAFIDSRSAI